MSTSQAATSHVKVLRTNVPEDDVLVEALLNLFASAKKTIDPFVLWSETTTAVNQKNFVATLRQVMMLPPQKSLENTMVTVGAMKMIVRLQLNTTNPKEVLVMKDQFDAACVKSFAALKQQGGSGYEWWTLNKSWAKLVVPEDSTTEALNEKHDLADVVGHIDICGIQ